MGSFDWKGWDSRFWGCGEGIEYIEWHVSRSLGLFPLLSISYKHTIPSNPSILLYQQTNNQPTNQPIQTSISRYSLSFNQQQHTHTNHSKWEPLFLVYVSLSTVLHFVEFRSIRSHSQQINANPPSNTKEYKLTSSPDHRHVPRHRCWSHGRRQRNRSHPHRYHQRHRRLLRCPHLLLDLRKLRR